MRRTVMPVLLVTATLLAGCSSSSSKASAPDATAVVAKLKAARLPIGAVIIYTAENDPNHLLGRPGGYLSKAGFADTRINPKDARDDRKGSVDLGGDIEVFADAAGANARADYIRKAMAAMPMLGTQYEYVSGSVLLRLSQVLTPDQAVAYQKALG